MNEPKTKTIHFFSDPRHGWAKVYKRDLIKFNVHEKISWCSFEKGLYAYLEGDVDFPIYFKAVSEAGYTITSKLIYSNRRSRIRSYSRYQSNGFLKP